MSEWLNRVFSGGVSLARVNTAGIVLMALSVVLIASNSAITRRIRDERRESASRLIRISGLLLCAAGAIVSIY